MNAEVDLNFNAPVKSISIEMLLRHRQAIFERLTQARALIAEAESIAQQSNLVCPRIEIFDTSKSRHNDKFTGSYGEAIMQRALDARAWRYLLDESGLKSVMDATARELWNKTLDGDTVPELTRDNIVATFKSMHASREDMFNRGVIACFKQLSWDYKTNKPFKFGKRIIMGNLFRVWGSGAGRHLSGNFNACDQLDDLMRIFHVVDGKPEADHRAGMYKLIDDAHDQRLWQAENDYLHIKWYKKGSGHVTFKRPELVERLNDILSKHFPNALPAPRD